MGLSSDSSLGSSSGLSSGSSLGSSSSLSSGSPVQVWVRVWVWVHVWVRVWVRVRIWVGVQVRVEFGIEFGIKFGIKFGIEFCLSSGLGYIHLNLLFFIVYTPWPKRRNKKKAKVITRWIITGLTTGLKIWKMIYRKNRSKKYLWNILIYFQVYVYLKSSNTFLEHNLSSEYFSYFPPLTWIYNVLLQQFSNLGNKFALVLTVEKVKLRGKLRCFFI